MEKNENPTTLDEQFELAQNYRKGENGVKQNQPKAFELYKNVAEHGHVKAQRELAYCYFEAIGVKQNYEEALKWFVKAADGGDMYAQGELGFIYYEGKGVEKDLEIALKWFKKAAKQGHEDAKFFVNAIKSTLNSEWYGLI